MRDVYYNFLEIIREAFDEIEERLEPISINSDGENGDELNMTELSLEEELAMI